MVASLTAANDLHLKPAQFFWPKKTETWTILKARCQGPADMRAPVKVIAREENFALHALQFQNTGVCRKFPHGVIIMDCIGVFVRLISHAWLHYLNRRRNPVNVLKRLAPIVATRIDHINFPSKITSIYFIWFTKVMFKIWRYSTGLCPRQKKQIVYVLR